jgi:hypothetical protein
MWPFPCWYLLAASEFSGDYMHPSEIKYIQMAQQLIAISLQISTAHNNEQAALELHKILVAERLSTPAGTEESRDAISRFSELTERYKIVFNRLITGSAQQFLAVIAEIPEGVQGLEMNSLATQLNEAVGLFAQQYEDRTTWVAAAFELCDFIDDNRDCSGIVNLATCF